MTATLRTPRPTEKFDTSDKIFTHLEGKTLVMEGVNIPSHPNGLDEDVNFEGVTQCYTKVEMSVASGNFQVTSTLGTLRDAPAKYSKGTCNHAVANGTAQVFTASNAVLIENVKADATCFDITLSYTGFKQVGRGSASADGKTLTLELYFRGSGLGCYLRARVRWARLPSSSPRVRSLVTRSKSTPSPRSSTGSTRLACPVAFSRGVYDVVVEG